MINDNPFPYYVKNPCFHKIGMSGFQNIILTLIRVEVVFYNWNQGNHLNKTSTFRKIAYSVIWKTLIL